MSDFTGLIKPYRISHGKKFRLKDIDTGDTGDFESKEVAEELLPPRRDRINPRVIKRKMSKWKKKQAHHRNYPQPTQAFIDTIVVLG